MILKKLGIISEEPFRIKLLCLIVFIFFVLLIFFAQTTFNDPLNNMDGINHFNFINTPNCEIGYPNGLCLMFNQFNFNHFELWTCFFIISCLIPLFFVIYKKDLLLFPLWFIFTGFFWNTMSLQVFAQITLSLFFVFFIFEKNRLARYFVLLFLSLGVLFNIRFHNMQFIFVLMVLFYELILLIYPLIKNKIMFLGCGVISSNNLSNNSSMTHYFRQLVTNQNGNLFQTFVYYFFNLFVENMLFVFVIPAIYEIFNNKDFRKIYYFLVLVCGAFGLWVIKGFSVWEITRIFIWLPLILFVPFVDWLQRQKFNTQVFFMLMGFLYFCFNVYYYFQRLGELNC